MSIRYVKMVVNAGDSVLEKKCERKVTNQKPIRDPWEKVELPT